MKNKKLCVCLLALCCILPMQADDQAEDKADDWGAEFSVELSKKIIRKVTLSFEEEFRLHKNFSQAERFSHSLDLSYKPYKFLKGGLSYNLLNYHRPTKGWDNRHRAVFYLTGNQSFGRFNISLRERVQCTYRPELTSSDHNPKWYLRSRINVKYDIKKSHFEPFASAEMYYSLNDPNPANHPINRWRFVAGTKYNINKKNSIQLNYRYVNYRNDDDDSGHKICIGYSLGL